MTAMDDGLVHHFALHHGEIGIICHVDGCLINHPTPIERLVFDDARIHYEQQIARVVGDEWTLDTWFKICEQPDGTKEIMWKDWK